MIEFNPAETLALIVCLFLVGYLARSLCVDLRRSRKRSSKRFAHLLQNAPGQKEDRS